MSKCRAYMARSIEAEAVANEALGYPCVEVVDPTHGGWL